MGHTGQVVSLNWCLSFRSCLPYVFHEEDAWSSTVELRYWWSEPCNIDVIPSVEISTHFNSIEVGSNVKLSTRRTTWLIDMANNVYDCIYHVTGYAFNLTMTSTSIEVKFEDISLEGMTTFILNGSNHQHMWVPRWSSMHFAHRMCDS